jgi:hypothetical protein
MSGQPFDTASFLDDIARWRKTVGTRAPAYHRVLAALTDLLLENSGRGAEVGDRLKQAWASRTFQIFYERPLLFLAALRMDALVQGSVHPLWHALGASRSDPESVNRGALLDALVHKPFWESLRTRFVQTNETSRAVAWLWPAAIIGCSGDGRPLYLLEIGTAAGLNLVADRLPPMWTTPAGEPLPTARGPKLMERTGVDAHPLDVRSEPDANWIRACVWAGESERLARLEAAIAAFRSSPAPLATGDVTEGPKLLQSLSLKRIEQGVVFAFQTIVRDYLDAKTLARYQEGMNRWLMDAPLASALWVELELDHQDPEKRAAMVVHTPGPRGPVEMRLGTTGYHPTSVFPDETSVGRLRKLFRNDLD